MCFQKLIKATGCLLLVFAAQFAYSQNSKTVSGTVTDSRDGTPLRGASVAAKGTTVGTTTNNNGSFSLTVDNSVTVLVVSSVGYATQEISIDGRSNINIVMVLTDNSLGEVVVIGYGTARRRDVTGAISTVTAEDFNEGPLASPEQLIAGKVAGVQVTTADGLPGTGGRIRVRGTSSLAGSNDPLIIVDGIPLDQQSGISGAPSSLALINPNDIESMTILKDASATAIYGNRATNGVIIITTKKGKSGKFRLEFSTLNSLSVPGDHVDVMSADEFRALVNDKGNSSQQGLLGSANTDWQDLVYRNAFSTDNIVTMSGGISKLPYRLSLGYLKQNGILKTGYSNRFSTALNLNPRLLNNSLRVDIALKASFADNFFANNGAIGGSAFFDPTQPTHRNDNRLGGYFEWMAGNNQPEALAPKNPLGQLYLRDDKSDVTRYITTLQLDYTLPFFKDLRANLNLGYDYSHGEGTIFIPDSVAMAYSRGGVNNRYEQKKKNKVFEFYLNYVKDIKSIRSRVDVTAGHAYQDFFRLTPNFPDNRANGTEFAPAPPFPFETQNTLLSYFGRVEFAVNNKYILRASIRRDGSSRFSPENRWGTFTAAAFAWNIGEESFLANSKTLSTLKLRLSYGETGQQEIGNDYAYIANYTLGTQTAQYQFGSQFHQLNRPVGYDANIRWETTTAYNAGLDFGFANDRINGSIDYYNKETEDLLSFIDVPAGTNFTNRIFTNVGSMENKGFEFMLNGTIIKKTKMTWDAGFNLTYYKNEVTKLTNVDDPSYIGVQVGDLEGAVGNTIQIHSVGYEPSSFFVLQQVYDADGSPVEGLYVDQNHDGLINNLDYYRYKSSEPDVLMGFHSMVSCNRWTFSTVLRASLGNYMYNNLFSSGGVFSTSSVNFLSNVHRNYLETGFGTYQYFSDYYVENASFLRMDNISASYDFGQIMKGKANLRASFSVNNVFVVTDYRGSDPEISSGVDRLDRFYPRPRVFSIGLNLTL